MKLDGDELEVEVDVAGGDVEVVEVVVVETVVKNKFLRKLLRSNDYLSGKGCCWK